MARFFIDRPIFATVISLFLVLAGVITLLGLPIAQFPQIALPTVKVSATYLGANADVVEESVSSQLDTQINGVTNLLYQRTTSANDGTTAILVTLALERDPDLATNEVQSRVSQAQPKLPSEVINAGVTVLKQSPDVLMYIAAYSPNGTRDKAFLDNFSTITLADTLKRVRGIGDVQVFGADFGMRIWLQPDRMASLGLTVEDVANAIREQNKQVPAGQIGAPPAPEGQTFQNPVRVQGRMVREEEFARIIVRSLPGGEVVRIEDVARVELSSRAFDFTSRLNGKPATILALFLAPGANAIESAGLVRAEIERLRPAYPSDVSDFVIVDNTEFVHASIEEVVHTFVEALILVLVVVMLFLQSWRATLIPMLAVPVSLVATFIAYQVLGFSVNTLSLFGMVLAIGIVVDDAIVVVEAVEHKIAHEKLSAKDATRRAMDEVSGPVFAIALVLAAVFVPMAFIPGVTGQLYKQFALTVAVSVMFSALVALTLTPALCGLMLKPRTEGKGPIAGLFRGFNRGFDWLTARYGAGVTFLVRRSVLVVGAMGAVFFACWWLFQKVPTGFVPEEDQGYFYLQGMLPEAAAQQRSSAFSEQVGAILAQTPGVDSVGTIVGYDIVSGATASNAVFFIVRLKPWEERQTADLKAPALMLRVARAAAAIPEGVVIPFNPPALPGMGSTGGFSFMLQARGQATPQELMETANAFVAAAQARPEIGRAYTTFSASLPGYDIQVDREKARKLGVRVDAVFGAIQTFLGGFQVNDFTRFGRNYKVVLQAEPAYRERIETLRSLFVRNDRGGMVPLDTLVSVQKTAVPKFLLRYNLYRTAEIGGMPAPGYSSGQAIRALEEVAAQVLPAGYGYEWSGQSKQEIEAGGTSNVVFALSILIVFLFLAALYESWSVPFAVLLAVPLGVMGALASLLVYELDFNVYGQIGLVTLVGLAAKNAILIVEFAKLNRESGMELKQSAIEAAKLRLRPILMTSFAFILGCIPLAIASGAGAASKVAVGISVVGGMAGATFLAIYTVPVLFVLIQGLSERFGGPPKPKGQAGAHAHGASAAPSTPAGGHA